MKHIFLALSLTASLAQPAPVKLVFDTDMGNDVDDLMALCMIHNLQQRGACELLAVTITKDHPQAAAFTDAVNTFFGAPDTPVGVVRNGATPEPGKFNRLADEKNADGSFRYPHDRPTWDPTALLYAVYPDRGYFDLSPPGAVTVEDNGATWFRASREGKGPHRFLVS